MKTRYSLVILTFSAMFLSACSQHRLGEVIADSVEKEAACGTASSKMTDLLAQTLLDGQDLPIERDIEASFEKIRDPQVRAKALEIYSTMSAKIKSDLGLQSRQQLVEALIGLEIGDETSEAKARLKQELRSQYAQLKTLALSAGMDCQPQPPEVGGGPPIPPAAETPPSGGTPPQAPEFSSKTGVLGARRVLATAYQSCDSLRQPAMTRSSENAEGISIVGTHENGVGKKRVVSDVGLLSRTHYYVREGIENSSCFNVQKNPLIYDYGGKPSASTDLNSKLNLFKNAGTGTSALGIDCSGYVFSALASSGLRVSQGQRLKASQVYGINAKMYMEPKANGLSCFAPVSSTRTGSLKMGDVLASAGHIVMVGELSADPFGLAGLNRIELCDYRNISTSKFKFTLYQSAPVNGGLGIVRYEASEYLASSSSMGSAMLDYAVAACKARFGQASLIKPSSARLVRHLMTPECLDRPVELEGASCVQSCTK